MSDLRAAVEALVEEKEAAYPTQAAFNGHDIWLVSLHELRAILATPAPDTDALAERILAIIGPDEVFPNWSKYPHRHRVTVKKNIAEVTMTMVEESAIRAALTPAQPAEPTQSDAGEVG